MEKVETLWSRRLSEHWQMTSRYLKLLSNSGFMFTLYILIIGGGYFYQQWVKGLPTTFPTEWILLILFSFFIIRSPIRTLLRSADLVFLLPLEDKLAGYFKKAMVYSFILQSIPLIFVWAIALPLYLHTVDTRFSAYGATLVVLIIIKGWNILCAWQENYLLEANGYKWARGVVSLLFIGLLLFEAPWYALALLVVITVGLTLFSFHPLSQSHLLKWEVLLEIEERQAANFDRFANLITDVPHMKNRIKPRRYLNSVTEIFSFGSNSVFKRFFSKTFLRSGEYFGIYIRLIIVGAIVIWMVSGELSSVIIAVITVYLTAMQLLPMWSSGQVEEGPALLYPIPEQVRQKNFLTIFMFLLTLEALLLAIISCLVGIPILFAFLILAVGIVFSFLFTYGYASRKLHKEAD
ncbi:protein EcsB [Pullulanibacillus camelliae]|uniref:Protein EcsB n=1 Tax=Pullulanibacillus camelliae TaxID=1707096 RepID=A0A8J2YI53_9BACL|nr:ABC transporter permease [Pullulanibacillus camelliae]GGE44495.1 protein EcsB [Pullulanibacillus camelliae]